ncbi:hypothetical protein KUTeg_012484 [Tegillarca granosa]|uniref:Uncharacterized protein n=1 Tax=Tegillarca granosa TaxID=220873 RepID=A0ABQ9EZU6_TEGGR|nr:hypothetical protein KUTeg_012484 [Tegillarca granosa]
MDWFCHFLGIYVLAICLEDSIAPVIVKHLGSTIVNTKHEVIKGVIVEFPNSSDLSIVNVFSGLRYASLRDGRLRFIPPASLTKKRTSVQTHISPEKPCSQKSLKWKYVTRELTRQYVQRLYNKLGNMFCIHIGITLKSRDISYVINENDDKNTVADDGATDI